MIGLNSQPENGPMMFLGHLFNDLLQAIMHRADQDLAPALWTPDDVVDDQVDCMLFVRIFHVDNYSRCNTVRQHIPTLAPAKERLFIPRMNDGGFQVGNSVNGSGVV